MGRTVPASVESVQEHHKGQLASIATVTLLVVPVQGAVRIGISQTDVISTLVRVRHTIPLLCFPAFFLPWTSLSL